MAAVAGIGVWTTHFIAMLGYRTDLALTYDLGSTLVSAGASLLAIGIPLAISGLVRPRSQRVIAGASAGVGICVMHVIGMAAIQGCEQQQSPAANILACLVGGSAMGYAFGTDFRRHGPMIKAALFVVAVCGTHFISIAGTALFGQSAGPDLLPQNLAISVLVAGGAVLLLLGAAAVVMTVRRFERQEEAHAAVLSTALQNMSNGILKLSASEHVEIFNRRLLGMLQLDSADLFIGQPLTDFVARVGRANGWDEARQARVLANHRAWMTRDGETRIEHVFDDARILSIACQPVADGAVLTYEDVSKARQAQQEIAHLAYHDPLTGLANRRSLQERVATDLGAGRRFTLLLLDLDRFKFVNDTFGHSVGDRLLQSVAGRLAAEAEDGVFISRLGGDEMAVLVYQDLPHAQAFADRVIRALEEPYGLSDCTLVVGCSIGLCCTDDAGDFSQLMQHADLALYEAKRNGRGQAISYQIGMIEAVTDRNRLENDLRVGLSEGQFHLVYQPIRSLSDETTVGFEALIRWQHPTRGVVSPVTFIPLAEETGLIVAIGRWVLAEACREATRWPKHQHVAVNVSAVQFRSPQLLADITGALAGAGLPPHRLEIELTETALVEDGQHIAHQLAAIRALGIRVAMDDFGTGYSSLAHLRDLPLDRIKIDRSFVATALSDPHSLAVIRAITQMGRDMHIETLAEGIETAEQLELLRKLGCGAAQGYHIGRPARPADQAVALLSRAA